MGAAVVTVTSLRENAPCLRVKALTPSLAHRRAEHAPKTTRKMQCPEVPAAPQKRRRQRHSITCAQSSDTAVTRSVPSKPQKRLVSNEFLPKSPFPKTSVIFHRLRSKPPKTMSLFPACVPSSVASAREGLGRDCLCSSSLPKPGGIPTKRRAFRIRG